MVSFKKEDRIVVTSGKHHNKHGKIVGDTIGFWVRQYPVKLDSNETLEISEGNLRHEDLKPSEITSVFENITNQLNQVVSQLPEEISKEVPTHLGYLAKALASGNKDDASREYDYVTKSLQAAAKNQDALQGWMQTIKTNIEKLNWAVKRLS